MSGKYRGFFDILTGFLLGAGTIKIYYESFDDNGREKSFIFRRNKQKIDEICTTHDNLRFGKDQRVIIGNSHFDEKIQGRTPSVFQYGAPERTPEILYYKDHVLAYDYAKKVPFWVAQHLTAEKLNFVQNNKENNAERTRSNFRPDPNIPGIFQSTNEDYYKSGWTRGHMAPAGDNKHDQQSMNETFLLSNIIPQNFDNNANYWYRMEVFCRGLAKKFKDVYVISGPLWLPSEEDSKKIVKYEVIGENNVAVPTHLFKIILAVDNKNKLSLAAFEIPNSPIQFEKTLTDFLVPLTKLEKDTGFNFFKDIKGLETSDLCKTTGCKLLSKEIMENITTARKLSNCKSVEELERLWEDAKSREDSFIVSVYQKKQKELIKRNEQNNEN